MALRLAFRAGPAMLGARLVLVGATAFAPVVTAWLIRLMIDGLAAGHQPPGRLWSLAGGLALVGVLAAVASESSRYLELRAGRQVAYRSMDVLYTAVNRLVGLRRLESPQFYDHLRMAQEAGASGPSQLVAAELDLARARRDTIAQATTVQRRQFFYQGPAHPDRRDQGDPAVRAR
jgi:ATP-binding cassette subfamily B protein